MKTAQEMLAITTTANAERPVSHYVQNAIEDAASAGFSCVDLTDVIDSEKRTLEALGYHIRVNTGKFAGTITVFWK